MIMKQVEEEYFKLLHDSELQKDGIPSEKLNNVLTPFMHSISETQTVRSAKLAEGGVEGVEGVEGVFQNSSVGFSQDSELMSASKIGGGKDDPISKNQEAPQKKPDIVITIPQGTDRTGGKEKSPPVPAKKAVPKTSAVPFWRTQGRKSEYTK